jgi:hypothetical protein
MEINNIDPKNTIDANNESNNESNNINTDTYYPQ